MLAGLEGTFKGHGKGSFPTIQPFSYGEEVTFKRLGTKNVFSYVQRTWNQETQAPMHAESGFLRVFDDRMVEFVLAQPTGLAEIEHGRCYLNDHGLVCMDTEVCPVFVRGVVLFIGLQGWPRDERRWQRFD